MPDSITLKVNGELVSVPAGSMVSTAVAASFSSRKTHEENTKDSQNSPGFRLSVTGQARAPLCGNGEFVLSVA
jgi:hypothetical protein